MTGCVRLPLEPIVPYVRQPEGVIPGRPMYYATASTLGGYASPLLVESHLGRPTKIEGNDLHPASLGGTDIFAQASILGLYDPDRSQTVTSMGDVRSWQAFLGAIRGPLSAQKALQGAGIRILTPTISSPTLADQLRNFLKIYPAGQVARLRAGQSRQRPRRREAGLRPARRNPLRFLESRRHRLPRRRLPLRRIPRQHPLHPRLRQPPQSRQRQHEPPVRHREHAEFNGREGGSSVPDAGRPRSRGFAALGSPCRTCEAIRYAGVRLATYVSGICGLTQDLRVTLVVAGYRWRSSAPCGSCSRARHERRRLATSARPSSTPIPSTRIRSIRPSRSKISSPT